MEQCPRCRSFLVSCPCCDESFCPTCGGTEEELDQEAEGND